MLIYAPYLLLDRCKLVSANRQQIGFLKTVTDFFPARWSSRHRQGSHDFAKSPPPNGLVMQWSMRWFDDHVEEPICQDKAQSRLVAFFDDEEVTAIRTPKRLFPRAPPVTPVEKKEQLVLQRLHSSMPGSPKASSGLRRDALLWAAGQASPRFPSKPSLRASSLGRHHEAKPPNISATASNASDTSSHTYINRFTRHERDRDRARAQESERERERKRETEKEREKRVRTSVRSSLEAGLSRTSRDAAGVGIRLTWG